MKDKLSVGMFIRTPLGIDKIIYLRIQDEYGCNFDTQLKHNLFLNNERDNISIDGECFEKEEIKTSYNIIDILEVGDVIIDKEGHKYPINYEFETDYNGEYNSYEITIDDHITLFLKDDLSIVTHEQMEQMAYKVVSE